MVRLLQKGSSQGNYVAGKIENTYERLQLFEGVWFSVLLGTQQFHNTLDFLWRELGFHFVGVKYNTHEFNNPTWTDSFVRYNGDVEGFTRE